jgi:hypothetical protein
MQLAFQWPRIERGRFVPPDEDNATALNAPSPETPSPAVT